MEYLMTYSWAILIIAIVLGLLYQLGLFNTSFSVRSPPGACQVLKSTASVTLIGQCSGILPQYIAQFNGQSSYISMGNVMNTDKGDFTLVVWIKSLPDSSFKQILYKKVDGASGAGYSLYFRPSNPWIGFCVSDDLANTACAQSSAYNYRDGNWHQIVAEFKYGSAMSVYVDGAYSNSFSTASIVGTLSSSAAFNIGSGGNGGIYNGMMTNVQMYNHYIAPADIQTLYLEGMGGAPILPQNVIAWWPLNGNAKDYSGGNNNGAATLMSYTSQYS
jgi:hypothetical protein